VVSGNYRLGEFQGAILNCQLDRLETQTNTRDSNGRRLAARIGALPGVHVQVRPADCTRHSHHLFMLRIDHAAFGASRAAVHAALAAEGIPCSMGYGYSLPEQPLFRHKAFGPFLPHAAAGLDYRESVCPNSDLICREQALWLGQNLLLGGAEDVEDIAVAFEKVYAERGALEAAGLRST
jgi:dTDP-4-amino-4,6-dideoxygalactose transaminase